MADDDKGAAAPATGAAASSGETPKVPATGAGTPATGGTDSTPPPPDALTPEQISELVASNKRMEAALKEANKEAEKRRKELKDIADAKLPEDEKRAQELADLKKANEKAAVELAELRIEQEVNRLASTLGIVDPETVARLIDWDKLEFDTEGKAQNVESVVKEILVKKPFLAGKAATPAAGTRTGNNAADGTGGAGPAPNLTAAELEQARSAGMDPARYAALKEVKTLDQYLATRPKPS